MARGHVELRGHGVQRRNPVPQHPRLCDRLVHLGRQLLQRTRDIRVLVVLAKLAALDRNLPDLVDVVETIARLLEARWDEINPRAEDGDFSFRLASLQALDDMTHICLPLQFTPLIRHPRSGALTFRHRLLAEGLEPRDGEEFPDAKIILTTEPAAHFATCAAVPPSLPLSGNRLPSGRIDPILCGTQ